MLDAGTFEQVYQSVDNYINAMWVFGWKVDGYGWPTQPMVRVVARGDEQRAIIDFGEFLAPTVAMSGAFFFKCRVFVC